MVGKLGKCTQTNPKSSQHEALQFHPPATHGDSQLPCRNPRAISSKITWAGTIWGPTKGPSGPVSSSVELIRKVYFLAISCSVGVLTATVSPHIGNNFFLCFSALLLIIFGSYFAFLAAPEPWSCPFRGAACEGLGIPGGNGQSLLWCVQHVDCLLPPAPLCQNTSPSANL